MSLTNVLQLDTWFWSQGSNGLTVRLSKWWNQRFLDQRSRKSREDVREPNRCWKLLCVEELSQVTASVSKTLCLPPPCPLIRHPLPSPRVHSCVPPWRHSFVLFSAALNHFSHAATVSCCWHRPLSLLLSVLDVVHVSLYAPLGSISATIQDTLMRQKPGGGGGQTKGGCSDWWLVQAAAALPDFCQ